MEDAPEQLDVVVGRRDEVLVEERERDLVARAVDDEVGLDARAVGELDLVLVQAGDVRLGRDRAVGQPVEDPARDRRVRLAELVVGLLEAVVLHPADRLAHHQPERLLLDLERDPRVGEHLVAAVDGLGADVLGEDPGAAAGGEVDRGAVVAGVHRDVHRAVAHAEHDDPLAVELALVLVVVGVDLLDLRAVGAGEGGLGPAHVPVVAVGDEHRVVAVGLAGVGAQRVDAVGVALDVLDAGLEADAVAEAEVVDVAVEVRGDLRVVREVRVVGRHREVRVLHALARRVDVQRAVGAAHRVLVAEDPVAADAVGLLVAVERHAALVQRLGDGDAGRAGSDEGDVGQLVHAPEPSTKMTHPSSLS